MAERKHTRRFVIGMKQSQKEIKRPWENGRKRSLPPMKRTVVRDGYKFVYAGSNGKLSVGSLPRSRFISLNVRVPNEFVNLCELDWDDVQARDFVEDGGRLQGWMNDHAD